jgi:hypothetical protein
MGTVLNALTLQRIPENIEALVRTREHLSQSGYRQAPSY